MKRDDRSPSAYRKDVDGELKKMLEMIRKLILKATPEITEGIAHGMLDYPGLANLAAQKGYVALYVAPAILEKHKGNFPGVSCGKSCLRFKRMTEVDPGAVSALLNEVKAFRSEG